MDGDITGKTLEDNAIPPPAPSAGLSMGQPTRKGSARRSSMRVEVKKENFDDDREAIQQRQALKIEHHEADDGGNTQIVAPFLGKMCGSLAVVKEHSVACYMGGVNIKHRWHEIDTESFRWCKSHMKNSEEYNGVVPSSHIRDVISNVNNKEFCPEEAQFSFDIVTKDRTFHVAAESESELKSWVEAVQVVIDHNISSAGSARVDSAFGYTNPLAKMDTESPVKGPPQQEVSPYADILGDSLEGFHAISPHYSSEEYGVTLRDLNDWCSSMDLVNIHPKIVEYPEYLSFRDIEELPDYNDFEVHIGIPTEEKCYVTSKEDIELAWEQCVGKFNLAHKVEDVLDFVKRRVAESGTLQYASDESVFDRFVLQVKDSQDFILHRTLPLAFVDYIFRCVRMQEQATLVLRLLSVEERAALGEAIEESYTGYVERYHERYPLALTDKYNSSRLSVNDELLSDKIHLEKFVLLKENMSNHLKINVETVRFPAILDLGNYLKVRLEVTLVHCGNEITEEPMIVPLITWKQQRDLSTVVDCNAVLYTDLAVNEIPAETRVVIRLIGIDRKTYRKFVVAGANTMLFNYDFNLSSVPFDLDLTHIHRGTESATNRGSTMDDKDSRGSATSREASKDSSSSELPRNASHVILLDDDGNEIPLFQALHLNMCMPTTKDRRYLNLRDDGEGIGSLAGRKGWLTGEDQTNVDEPSSNIPSNRDSTSSPGREVMSIDMSVLRVVECVQVTMRFTVTKDKKFPPAYVIHSGQGSLVHTYETLEEEYGAHPDAHEDFSPTEEMRQELERVLHENDCLSPPSERKKVLLWCCREECAHHPELLPKFLQSVDWTNPDDVREVHHMLLIWRFGAPIEALELLDIMYSDTTVREYAVYRLTRLADDELLTILLQLVQVLKYEPYHDSALARFLVRRALTSPLTIGHSLFWMLYNEMHLPIVEERFGLLLSLYLSKCGKYRDSLRQQLYVNNRLKEIAQTLKSKPTKAKRLQFVQEQVAKLNVSITEPFCTCLDPKIVLRRLVPEKCKVMESKKRPLWLCFEIAGPGSAKYLTIFKDGDDLRQDQLTLQLIAFMDKVWRDDHLIDDELLVFTTFASTEAGMRRSMAAVEESRMSKVAMDDRLSPVIECDGEKEGITSESATAEALLKDVTEESSDEDEEEAAREVRDRERQRGGRDSTMSSQSSSSRNGNSGMLSGRFFGMTTVSESSDADSSPSRPKRRRTRRMSQYSAGDSAASSKGGKALSGWEKLKASVLSGKLFAASSDQRLGDILRASEDLVLDLKMKPYGCVSTGYNTGMIEVVTNSQTLAGIQTEFGGKLGAFSNHTMIDYLIAHNKDEQVEGGQKESDYDIAVDNFMMTCAGYCVCTYLLGIGDRHADNIMIQNSGHFFHIDFGHFLGNFKSKMGINRERSPFVFTPEMAEVIKQRFNKNKDNNEYVYGNISYHQPLTEFETVCTKAFNTIRKKARLLMNLFLLMIPACMPELTNRMDVAYLRHKLKLNLDDKGAAAKFTAKIAQCLGTTSRRIDNALHNLKHY